MSLSEEEVRKAAELKSWVESRMADLQTEIDKLKDVLVLVDGVLKRSSFKTAAEIAPKSSTASVEISPRPIETVAEDFQETRPLRRSKNDHLLANAFISTNSISIVPACDQLNVLTPPFKSFFLNRILEGMKTKDSENLKQGKLKAEEVINYHVDDESNIIRKIVINNYGDKNRLNEIISTAIWVFTRMIEKKE